MKKLLIYATHVFLFGLIPPNRRKKIQATGDHYVMLRYATNQRAYRLGNLIDKKVHIVRDVVFYEDVFPFRPNWLTYSPSPTFEPTLPKTTKAPDEDDESKAEEPGMPPVQAPLLEQCQHTEQPKKDDENLLKETPDEIMPLAEQADPVGEIKRKACEPPATHYPKGTRRPLLHLNDYLCFHTSPGVGSFEYVPTAYKTAIKCPESGQWLYEMKQKLSAIPQNITWTIC